MNTVDILLSEISQSRKGNTGYASTSHEVARVANLERQKVGGWLPGAGTRGGLWIIVWWVEFPVLQDEKISGGWLHNSVNIPNTVEVYVKNGYDGKFYIMYILPQ